jgi:hypothetical protein
MEANSWKCTLHGSGVRVALGRTVGSKLLGLLSVKKKVVLSWLLRTRDQIGPCKDGRSGTTHSDW